MLWYVRAGEIDISLTDSFLTLQQNFLTRHMVCSTAISI